MAEMKNQRRVCGRTTEGHGEYQTVWLEHEVKCPWCGKWTREYGEVSTIDDDGGEFWLCPKCGEDPNEEDQE